MAQEYTATIKIHVKPGKPAPDAFDIEEAIATAVTAYNTSHGHLPYSFGCIEVDGATECAAESE